MRRTLLLRFRPRYALLVVIGLLVGAAAGVLTDRAHAGPFARSAGAGKWMGAVALPVPSPGDVSYAVARVRIGPGSRLSSPMGLAGAQTIFASHVGGLTIRARSTGWRALRASTHVYVVVSMVPGASRSLRDVGFFILRRNASGGPASANVTFTIANARAQLGSFWVHRVDRRGYATVFAVRNILATALGNWSRYIRVLRLAHAIAAATHPLVLGGTPTASATAARPRLPGPWTGGQRPDARVTTMYQLIMGSIANPSSYALVKKDPAVADFIATELGNPSLAARWRTVVAQVPIKVPDKYAAAAQEERRFAKVVAPKITHAVVAIGDTNNSSQEAGGDPLQLPVTNVLTVRISGSGTGTVVVTDDAFPSHRPFPCTSTCTGAFDSYGVAPVRLTVMPHSGSTVSLSGCVDLTDYCEVWVPPEGATVDVTFTRVAPGPGPEYKLQVGLQSLQSGQSGTVTQVAPNSAYPINCPDVACSVYFPFGTFVTLRANPNSGSYFDHWNGCDSVASNGDCTVGIAGDKYVQANFGYP